MAAPEPIDLSGTWKFALDPNDAGRNATQEEWRFSDKIKLPGLVNAQGFGDKPSFRTKWTGHGWKHPHLFKEWQSDDNFKMPFFLTPDLHYVGPAFYQRTITIPADWKGLHTSIHLERVHWQSTLWVDGKKMGDSNALGTPHNFDTVTLTPGEHTITLRIDNRVGKLDPGILAHSLTDHTQGNWNGVVGKMQLKALPLTHLKPIRIDADPTTGNVRIRADVAGASSPKAKLQLIISHHGKAIATKETAIESDTLDTTLVIKTPALWDEFTPNLYQLHATLITAKGEQQVTETFGFRTLANNNGTLTLNGHPLFLRGTLDCAIFPNLGHPPTDVAHWEKIMRVCKNYGLNHIRFHSWCPPKAAFSAADKHGIYLQVECSSWANNGSKIGSGNPIDAWINAEAIRICEAYGNHPSFTFFSYGNEPAGANHAKWLNDWVAREKARDHRHLVTTAAGWPAMPENDYHNLPQPRIQQWGEGLKSIINAQPPRTDFNWEQRIGKYPETPIVSHEIGQWCVYPNFDEVKKYSGLLKPHNFAIFKETAKRNGLLGQAHDFLMASGKLQTLCYKHDIEAALRTRRFGGFQLLGLQDFPGQGTALIGVVDPFWDDKPYCSPEIFHRFCAPVVPLAELSKMVWTSDETLTATLRLSQFGPKDLTNLTPTWTLTGSSGEVVAKGSLNAKTYKAYALHDLGEISIPLTQVTAPAQLKLTVGAKGQDFSNDWDIFVYPARNTALTPENSDIIKTRDLGTALKALDQGKAVFWNPAVNTIVNDKHRPLVSGFSTIFWNTAWTNWQAPHTLGILVDPNNPAIAGFPTETHSNWQWWEIQKGAQPFILTAHKDLIPTVQVIDDWFTNRRLGLVFEARVGKGKLIASSADLSHKLDQRPAARQLRAALLSYMNSKAFVPSTTLKPADLKALLKPMAVSDF